MIYNWMLCRAFDRTSSDVTLLGTSANQERKKRSNRQPSGPGPAGLDGALFSSRQDQRRERDFPGKRKNKGEIQDGNKREARHWTMTLSDQGKLETAHMLQDSTFLGVNGPSSCTLFSK